MMRSSGLLALALLLTPGTSPAADQVPAAARTATGETGGAAVCRTGPDGGPVPSEGRLFGTARTADRGIGGTGAPPGAARRSDHGIGGTGIVGVITGFASLCIDGREVALGDAVPVLVDGERASGAALRAGQLAAVKAVGSATALWARAVAIRHEVSGPVEVLEANGVLRVAGQRVTISAQTWGERVPHAGDWVAVSGLRQQSGVIAATRLDRSTPGGQVTVHGVLRREGGTLRVGSLEVRLAAGGLSVSPGEYVTVTGRYRRGLLLVNAISADVLAENPQAYFGRNVHELVVEAYATGGRGHVQLGPGLDVAAAPGVGSVMTGRAVIELERRDDGSLLVTSVTPDPAD